MLCSAENDCELCNECDAVFECDAVEKKKYLYSYLLKIARNCPYFLADTFLYDAMAAVYEETGIRGNWSSVAPDWVAELVFDIVRRLRPL